ncbi:MAG: response regulator [Tannerella sp.]|nr:response regulator [Tannerella sp.]
MKYSTTYRLCCLTLLFVFLAIQNPAAINRNIRFIHLTNNEGLPGNSVYSICQDYRGFIWIGTKSGLCKYDGNTVSGYDLEIHSGVRSGNGQVRQVFQDSQNRLWVVAQKSVNLYDREKDMFSYIETDSSFTFRKTICEDNKGVIYIAGSGVQVYNEKEKKFETIYPEIDTNITENINSITSDTDGKIWLGKNSRGLVSVDTQTGKQISYRHNPNDPHSLISDRIVAIYTDKKGHIWVGSESKGVCYLDQATQTFHSIKGFPEICVRAFAEDQSGNLWLGTENGLYIYSPETGEYTNYKQNYNDRYSLNDNAIYTIFRDREDNILMGTYFGGINIFPSSFRQFLYYDYGYSDNYLSGKAVRQITGDKNENLWIATEDGGLNYYNRDKDQFAHFVPKTGTNSISYHNVHSVLLDSYSNLWIGTYLGGLNKYNLTTKTFTHYSYLIYPELLVDNVFILLEDRDKKIWIGTTNGLTVYDPETNKFQRFKSAILGSRSIDYLYEDSEGGIWIASRNNGIYCYNKSNDDLQNFSYNADGTGLSDNFINYIFEDSDRNIWIATHEGGICKYNKRSDTFTTFTTKDGLPSNTIYSIIESNNGNLWISTNNGLSCLNIDDYTFTNYSVSEGLPNKQFNYNSAWKAQDGLLFFGTINGMIAFYPEDLQTIKNIAKVEFSSLKILGNTIRPEDENSPLHKSIAETEEIKLNSEQAKSFTLDFTVPTLSHPNSIFFAIKLNTDRDWSYIGAQNHITYANLPPGEYMLQIKAAFNNRWTGNEPVKSMRIIISPPFWKSTIAYIIYLGLLILSAFLIFLSVKRRQDEKRMILAERLEKEKIREINALKLNFFTKISHELRTPLTLILTPIQSYLDKNIFRPEIRSKMKLVADNARRMNNLVDELILFTKIETKQEKIRVKKGDLLSFIEIICEGFEILAEEKGLNFITDISTSDNEVWFAPVKVEKIIYNLLSNAFKYTDEGEIIVKASYKHINGFTYLHLTVTDTGIGISPDQKEMIFENYYQVNDFVNGKKTGFGIGLALVRELVALHKGDIRVDSELNKGTIFTVQINVSAEAYQPDEISDKDADNQFLENYKYLIVRAESTEDTYDAANEVKINGKQYKLLIVEDNKELLNTYIEIFKDTYTLLTAENGDDGYSSAITHLPDLIISDVMMPGMNGFELTDKLKSTLDTCHIPVILLTAKTGEEAQMEGYESGADLYIEKPFHPTLIRKQISNLIATKENQKKRYKANEIDIIEFDVNEKDKKLISKIEKTIIEHLDDSTFSLNDLLREVGVGRTLLHVKLKSIVGLSTTEFINKIKLNESVKLLARGKNISEAAYGTGFSSPNYYSRCFKKFYGMSPNEYIKSNA